MHMSGQYISNLYGNFYDVIGVVRETSQLHTVDGIFYYWEGDTRAWNYVRFKDHTPPLDKKKMEIDCYMSVNVVKR
jgi:hypothetical protein